MLDRLFRALIASKNAAADEVLVDALRLGAPDEQTVVLGALLARKSTRGLIGVLGLFEELSPALQGEVVANAKLFHGAIREAAGGERTAARRGAIALVAAGRQGKLAYVLGESLRGSDEGHARAAAAALLSLSRWVGDATESLQAGAADALDVPADESYRQLLENRPDIETTVVRALELHHGSIGQELLSAATCLGDYGRSIVLQAARSHARGPALRRIQQSPEPRQASAFLLGATQGSGRAGFAQAFARIDSPSVLGAIARRAHWLNDQPLALAVRQIVGGAWLDEATLADDLAPRDARDIGDVARWIGASGLSDAQQDALLAKTMAAPAADGTSRLRALRVAIARPRLSMTGLDLLKKCLRDPDERIARLAARDLVRRRPAELENALLPLMADAPEGVRKLIGRAVARPGFESFWTRFDQMDRVTRRTAGRAIVKLLPDAIARLGRRLSTGPIEERLKGLQIAQELELVEQLKAHVVPLCAHASPRVRSKAVTALGQIGAAAVDTLLERVMTDVDPRVRANAVETMETRPGGTRFVPLLAERARDGANRERANAIKALHAMKVGVAASQLLHMLRDERPEHRISALWALRRIGWWRMLSEVATLAREDQSVKVRQYAMAVLQTAAGEALAERRKAG